MRYPVFVCDDDQMQVNDIVKMIGKAEEIISDEHAVAFDVASVTTFSEAKTYLKKNECLYWWHLLVRYRARTRSWSK